MISPEGEKIKFASPMFPKGEVEVWLRVVQDKMRDSLQKLTKKGKLDDQKER
jgi:acyl dehydratase